MAFILVNGLVAELDLVFLLIWSHLVLSEGWEGSSLLIKELKDRTQRDREIVVY